MNALCELSLCIVHSQGHIPLLFAKRSAETKFPFNILTLTTASCIHSHTITVLPLWRGVIVIITILTELVPLHSASYIPSDYVGSWNCVTVPPSFQVITHRPNFGPASRVNTVRKKKKKTQNNVLCPVLEDLDSGYFFLPFLNHTDCCLGCTNVQTVSSPLHLNPYRIKVKRILSSDYSSNLLNNVLLPSFSAAAEIPPSLMIQPPNRAFSPLSFSLSCIIPFGLGTACFWISPHPFKKKTEVTQRQWLLVKVA